MNVAVRFKKFTDLLDLVGREVVSDEVNFFAIGLVGHDVGEKRNELDRGVTRGRLAQHLAGLGVEGGIQRQRSVAEILEAMALGAPGDSGSTGSRRLSTRAQPHRRALSHQTVRNQEDAATWRKELKQST